MPHLIILTLILFSTSLLAEEQSPISLWPGAAPDEPANITSKKAPEETGADGVIRIPYVDTPEIIRYPAPADKATGTCILICPGGAYQKLAWNKEGTEIATWLNTIGVEAVVLKYRVPRRDRATPHPWPLQDVQRAIRIVRSHASEWKIAPDRIGVMGFSAGGHLAVMSSVAHDQVTYPPVDDIDKIDATPNFLTLIYPAYLGDMKKDPAKLDPMIKVDKNTPPTFIALTNDDSDRGLYAALFYAELRRLNIPAELHIFKKGGHGYGMRPSDNPVSQWPKLLQAWLKDK